MLRQISIIVSSTFLSLFAVTACATQAQHGAEGFGMLSYIYGCGGGHISTKDWAQAADAILVGRVLEVKARNGTGSLTNACYVRIQTLRNLKGQARTPLWIQIGYNAMRDGKLKPFHDTASCPIKANEDYLIVAYNYPATPKGPIKPTLIAAQDDSDPNNGRCTPIVPLAKASSLIDQYNRDLQSNPHARDLH